MQARDGSGAVQGWRRAEDRASSWRGCCGRSRCKRDGGQMEMTRHGSCDTSITVCGGLAEDEWTRAKGSTWQRSEAQTMMSRSMLYAAGPGGP